MKPKDPVWGFYDHITEGNKTISKCKACSSEVSSKVLRLKSHLEKCQKSVNIAKYPVITLVSESEPWKPETPTPKRKQDETNDDSLIHVNTPERQQQQTLNGFTVPTSAEMKDNLDEKFNGCCFWTCEKMAEQQVSEDLESAEYKKLLKYVLRKQIQLLVNQLCEETGEETVVLSANLTSGTTTYLGSELARTYLEEDSAWKTDFLTFLYTKNILRKGANGTANNDKQRTAKPFKAAVESSDLASKSRTGTGLKINKGKSKSTLTAAETDIAYDDACQQFESTAKNNKRKPAEISQSQTPSRKSQKLSNVKDNNTESCTVETLEMDAYTEAEQTALLDHSESFSFKNLTRAEISKASENKMTNLIPQACVQEDPMFQPTIISTDANIDMGHGNPALVLPDISSDTNMGEIYIKVEPQEDSDSADVDYGHSSIEEANISDNLQTVQNTYSGEDNDSSLNKNGCSSIQHPSVQNMYANKGIQKEVVYESSAAKAISPKPKKKFGLYDLDKMAAAIKAVRNKEMSIRKAAQLFAVPKSTLQEKVTRKRPEGVPAFGTRRILSQAEEDSVVTFILAKQICKEKVVTSEIVLEVKRILDEAGRKTQFKNNMPTNWWLFSFKKRHPELVNKFTKKYY